MRCHPASVSVLTHVLVRFAWEHAMFAPPTYTPTPRYVEAPQADIALALGAEQASNPRPV
jgi:hypothetical protein